MCYFSTYDFSIVEGIRTLEIQKEMLAEGKSKTLNSNHLTGRAFDIVLYDEKGKGTYDSKYYKVFTDEIKMLANKMGIKIDCGYDWGWDIPHIELDRKTL